MSSSGEIPLVIIVAFLAFVLGVFLGCATESNIWEDKMVEMGYAYYDSKTAEFTMKEVEE